ncbi:hypothetical protein ACWFR5_11160 [Streptomyces sp. NPDC055092]
MRRTTPGFRLLRTGDTDDPSAVAPVTADRTHGATVDGGKNLRKLKYYVEQDAPRP